MNRCTKFILTLQICLLMMTGALSGQSTNRFTIISLPDTQHYVDTVANHWHFEKQTQWIVDQRTARNIVFTTHEGDMVEHQQSVPEWEKARQVMSTLDKASPAVPYSIAWGNHDSVLSGDSLYGTYFGLTSGQNFGVTNIQDYPWWGGHFGLKTPTSNENNYQLFSAGGDDYLIIHLAFMDVLLLAYETTLTAEVNDDGTVKNAKTRLRWVDSILKAYPGRKAILTTHDFLTPQGIRTPSANFIWDQVIVPNPNVFLVMNGHQLGRQAEARRSEFVNGRWVHQLLANYQSRANGGSGWLRIMEFSPSEKKIRVQTYSPSLDQYETDANSAFELVLGNDPGSSSDDVDPTVAITSPASNAEVFGMVTVSATASDNVRVAGVQFKLDGAYLGVEDAVEPYTATLDTNFFTLGDHVLSATARDDAGNFTITTVNIKVVADQVAPQLMLNAPANGSTVTNSSIVVNGRVWDDSGVAEVRVNAALAVLSQSNWSATVSGLLVGTNTVQLVAKDKAVPFNSVTQDVSFIYATGNFDGDQNGMPDTWEITYFGSVGDPRAGVSQDPDGDGVSNGAEIQSGTSPVDRESRLEIINQSWIDASQLMIVWKSVVGKTYSIESSSSLTDWSPAGTVVAGDVTSSWTAPISGEGKKFFRVKIP